MNQRKYFILLACFGIFLVINSLQSCKKADDWLNAKRQLSDVTPATLKDYQALLDNYVIITNYSNCGLLGTDNIKLLDTNFPTLTTTERNLYTFSKDIWQDGISYDWTNLFKAIEYANVVLDGLPSIPQQNEDYNNIKGQAHFVRAYAYYQLSQLFCKPYLKATSEIDLGLPIRLSSDVNIIYQRSNIEETYQQMLTDASAAASFLSTVQITNRRPNKAAALGLLAKIYLVMGDYENAGINADEAINTGIRLMNYNDAAMVSPTATYPFPAQGVNNPEILFYASSASYISLGAGASRRQSMDTALYLSYDNNDLRKKYLYRITNGTIFFNGCYTGSTTIFSGIAVNELYLIRAECNARSGNISAALGDIDTLLKNRFVTGAIYDRSAPDVDSTLRLVLSERRKELPSTGNIRWEDLRRLNLEGKFQTTVIHTINGVPYSLSPNDPRYVLPIPDNEIQLSGIEQNPR